MYGVKGAVFVARALDMRLDIGALGIPKTTPVRFAESQAKKYCSLICCKKKILYHSR
jgi:hypothetical protein